MGSEHLKRVAEARAYLEQVDNHEDWESALRPVALIIERAIASGDMATLEGLGEPLRDAAADISHRRANGYVIGLLAIRYFALDEQQAQS